MQLVLKCFDPCGEVEILHNFTINFIFPLEISNSIYSYILTTLNSPDITSKIRTVAMFLAFTTQNVDNPHFDQSLCGM
jgi:hypothetical protein